MECFQVLVEVIRDLASQQVLPEPLARLPLTEQLPLSELGLDSLGRMSVLMLFEERTGVSLSESDLFGLSSLGDLATAASQ
ncbi:MAG: acyl carrier protein [Candidatus Xenobia bacterium]